MSTALQTPLILLLVLLGSITSALKFKSPCPDLFHYDSADQPNQWSGTVTLLSNVKLYGVWIRLIFDEKLTELHVRDNFGEVVQSDDKREFLIKNRNFLLKAGTPKDVKIDVKYEGEKIPALIGYRLNANLLCSGVEADLDRLFPGDIKSGDFLLSLTPTVTYNQVEGCGISPLSPTHFPDQKAKNEQWPWQASIYVQQHNNQKYICGATLISPRHILTPAHCVTYLKSELPISVRQLIIYLGENSEKQVFGAEKIILHPGYRATGLLNDLSIIQLDRAVVIGDYVRPVCLSQNADKKPEGFLVGYGIKEGNGAMGELGHAKVRVVGEKDCLKNSPSLKGVFGDGTLCGIYAEDDSPCVGDSGSSLVSKREGPKPVWELNGVVSVGVALQNLYVCNPSSSVLFVDIANYLKWIQAVVS